ncbi:hypothetical protein [Kutzneria chonburiensis]|uniref:Head-to-tail adaptor n=1 Tax=Kutzneria chonburiensis TaxID=1483604 RepID=A0ABV6N4P7_9PSEU|nr:hypothetical protein [Kutzneria chonburiensis]
MTAFATWDEFTARLPAAPAESERPRAEALLADASTLIRTHLGWLTQDPQPVPDAVRLVCLSVALRCFSNPLGITSESVGDYSYRRSSGSVAGMALTSAEIELLGLATGHPPVTSVRVTDGIEDTDRTMWSPIAWRGWDTYR